MLRLVMAAILTAWASAAFAAADLASDPSLDYARAAAVVVGRVVGIERSQEADEAAKQQGLMYVGYSARVRVVRTFKGTLDVGRELLIPVGGYWAKQEEADVSMAPLLRNTGLRALAFEVGAVYLLSLNPGEPDNAKTWWAPRSRQASILPVTVAESVPMVLVPEIGQVPLDQHIERMRSHP